MDEQVRIKELHKNLSGFLDERGLRLWAGAESIALGRGGIAKVSKATGLARNTISAGMKELKGGLKVSPDAKRIRIKGGGRKSLIETDPKIKKDLEGLMEPVTRGHPESSLLWTSKSLRKLGEEMKKKGHHISHRVVGEVLKTLGYSLQANRKRFEGGNHPDRDRQFEYIYEKTKRFQQDKCPVISVDTKKKELVGRYKNAGREWRPEGSPEEVNVYDFPDKELGKAIPYGVYDMTQNQGWVSVGNDHDTAEFAVDTIRQWWDSMGKPLYPQANQLFITADGGGSNGSRVKLWKLKLQEFSNETGLSIHVSHFPPGTSKWNKIEHRLFSYITKNWRGKPLTCYQTIVNLIANTTTTKGLIVKSQLNTKKYPKGIKVSDKMLGEINLLKEAFHGEWNYIISPNAYSPK